MKAIYASKLFQTSKRKDSIVAALADPSNAVLVQQLAANLDEEYRTPSNLGMSPKSSDVEKESSEEAGLNESLPHSMDPGIDESSFDPSRDLMPFPSSDNLGSFEEGPAEPETEPAEREEAPEPKEDSAPAKEEANSSTSVEACTPLILPDPTASILGDLNIIKGTLNSVETTAGVIRAILKENELWLYYDDSINLNNIMTDVIDYMDRSGYKQFEFNRLARSDNAIVFVNNEVATVIV